MKPIIKKKLLTRFIRQFNVYFGIKRKKTCKLQDICFNKKK